MKLHWFGLLAGMLFYFLALLPGLLPHRADMLFMIFSGMLVATSSFLGFDNPSPLKKLSGILMTIGGLVLLGGVFMVLIGHPYILYIVAVPSLGFILFGLRQLLFRDE
jgi:hypothetical protein